MTSLPTGTVTFLFADIEGSTKLAREYRGAWEALRDPLSTRPFRATEPDCVWISRVQR